MKCIKRITSVLFIASFMVWGMFAQAEDPNDEVETVEEVDTQESVSNDTSVTISAETKTTIELPAAATTPDDGLYTMFSQVFAGKPFKKIDITLINEEFQLISSGAENASLEIKSNYKEKVPVVTNDGKTLKIVQKDKKVGTLDGRKCVVILTLPERVSPADFILNLADGKAKMDTFSADNVKITITNGELNVVRLTADKSVSISMGEGFFTAGQLDTKTLTATATGGRFIMKKLGVESFAIGVENGSAILDFTKPFIKLSALDAGSGTITAAFPGSMEYYSTISVGKGGNYHSDFITDTKGPELKVKFTKGTVTVSKL